MIAQQEDLHHTTQNNNMSMRHADEPQYIEKMNKAAYNNTQA